MKIEQQELIKNAAVNFNSYRINEKKPWYGRFSLNIKGYVIEGKTNYFATIDEAVQALKEKIAEAVTTFNSDQ